MNDSYSPMMNQIDKDKENEKRGIKNLIGVILMGIFASEYNLLGFLFPYFISYFRVQGQIITIGDMIFLPIIWIVTVAPSTPISIMIKNKLGYKYTLLFYLYFFILINLLCQLITNYKIFCVVYGISGGILQGAYMSFPTVSTWRFFPESKKAIINGIIFSCFAFSPFITSYIVYYSINPNNESQSIVEILPNGKEVHYFSVEVSNNLSSFFRNFSFFAFIFGSLGALLCSDPIDHQEPKGDDIKITTTSLEPSNTNVSILQSKFDLFVNEIKRIFQFEGISWLFLMVFLNTFYPCIINFIFKSVGLNSLKDDKFVTFCGSFGALINGTFRIFAGVILNKIGFKYFYTLLVIMQFSFSLLFVPMSYTKVTFLLVVTAYEVCYSFTSVLPIVFNKMYKHESAYLFGISYFFISIGVITSLNLYYIFEKHYTIHSLLIIVALISISAYLPMKKILLHYNEAEKENN